MMQNVKGILLLATLVLWSSCSNDDDTPMVPSGAFESGVFLLNEGNFGGGNGSVSFLSEDFSTLQNGVFSSVNNGGELGDVLQSAAIYADKIYFVVNNSNRIVVANRTTLEQITSFETGLRNPRHMAVVGNKGYVSNWGEGTSATDDFVAVIDLENDTILSTIPVSEGPEKMAVIGSNIYVLHQGGFGQGNSISRISSSSDTVVEEITVGDVPQSFERVNNTLWVLCRGRVGSDFVTPETAASIWRIAGTTTEVYDFESISPVGTKLLATDLQINNSDFYVQIRGGGVQRFAEDNLAGIAQIIPTNFYSLELLNNRLLGLDAGDFASAGRMFVYELDGTNTTQFETGIIPTFVLAQP